MSRRPSVALRRRVILRAGDRCEYCRLAQAGQAAAFHVDHVLPVVAGGPTEEGNLALACVSCSLRKGARTETIDPDTGEQARIFDPRTQRWDDHFMWSGVRIDGRTSIGRATVDGLSMNRPLMLAIRVEEQRLGRHPN